MSNFTVLAERAAASATVLRRYHDEFGPGATGRFDFTILFEDVFLSIVPAMFLLLLAPLRMYSLYKQPLKVKKSSIHESKMLFFSCYSVLELALLVLWAIEPSLGSSASFASASLSFLAALCLTGLSHLEHLRSVRPSALINVYLLLTLLFDIAKVRTLWQYEGTSKLAAVYSSTIGVKVFLFVVEAMEKRDILFEQFRHPSPEVTAGVWSQATFSWLVSLLRLGFGKELVMNDLYPNDDSMTTTALLEKALTSWSSWKNKTKARAFVSSTMWNLKWQMFLCILPRLCQIGFKYAQPFLVARTISFSENKGEGEGIGWTLVAAFGLTFTGLAITTSVYKYYTTRLNTCVRGELVTMIYTNTMSLGMGALEENKALTLMSTDVETIVTAFGDWFEPLAAAIEISIASYLLYNLAGIAFVAPVIVAAASLAGISVVARKMGTSQKVWIERIEKRVNATATWLSNAKVVKMLGFTDILSHLLQNLRGTEIKSSKRFRKIFQLRILFSFFLSQLGPLLTFTILVATTDANGRTFDASRLFSILAILTLIAEPFSLVIILMPMFASALKCFDRIQDYLNAESRSDHRLVLQQDNSGHTMDIVTQDASISWSTHDRALIRNLNFSIKQGQITFFLGPVGCGKSTLLKALLGEAPLTQGFIYTRIPTAAYVDQTPWIKNGSFRSNVLGISNYDATWYNTVLHACALDIDVAKMASGDRTAVGSGGISLSGGQKQRLALARAVYSKHSVVMIDDAFSGLDHETEEHVFSRLLGPSGILRKSGVTVLLVTHAVHRLAYSDHIISLSSNGSISEQGNYNVLASNGGYVTSLALKHDTRKPSVEKIEPEATASTSRALADVSAKEEEDVATRNQTGGDLTAYLYYFELMGNWRTVLYMLLTLLAGAALGLQNLVLTYWSNAASSDQEAVNHLYLGIFGGIIALTFLLILMTAWHFLVIMVPASAEIAHARLLKSVMAAPLSFFTSTDVGTTVNRFSQDLAVMDLELPYKFIDFSFSFIAAIMGAILMCLVAGYFAATLPAVVLSMWVIQKFYLRTSKQLRLLDLEAKAPLYSHFIESLTGLMTVRAFGWTSEFEERNMNLLDASQRPFYLLFCMQQWLALVLDLLVTVLGMILMIIITKTHNGNGGFVGLALVNVMTFNLSLTYVIRNWTGLETSLGAISRIRSFCDEAISEDLAIETNDAPPNWPTEGRIELKNVSAAYKVEDKPVINNIDLTIKPGERVGLCGRSGSGKSSILATIFRMLELSEGSSIAIDGLDLSTMCRQQVRRSINAIPQDPVFLKGTVRYNADPRNEHDDTAILAALQHVQLGEIVTAKGGLAAELDIDFFSHGQRQLFCLARAVLRKSKILVLDEATSSVDVKTDLLMQEIIRKEFKDCTILAVAHRLDTIMDFDKIVVLDGGRIIEADTPSNLMARDSAFRRLYNS